MNTSANASTYSDSEPQQDLVIYPYFWGGRKRLLIMMVGSLLFVICLLWIGITSSGEDALKGWGDALFFGGGFFTSLILLTWGPLIRINEQKIILRPNPFLKRIELQWDELSSIVFFTGRGRNYLDFFLDPTQCESILQRQSPFYRSILAKGVERSCRIARFSSLYVPYQQQLHDTLQERYYTQLQQHHITLE